MIDSKQFAVRLAVTVAFVLVTWVVISAVSLIHSVAYGQTCSGGPNEWSWSAEAGKSCAPCSYNQALTGDQIKHHSCRDNSSSDGYSSGTGDVWGVRVSWPANPANQNVDRYDVQYRVNNGGWVDLQTIWDATQVDISLNDYQISPGVNFCARVRAGTWDQWSPYSVQGCIDIPGNESGGPTQPGQPSMTLLRG